MEKGVSFRRIKSAEDTAFAQALALYATSFPEHEQRTPEKQEKLLQNPQYHFDVVYYDGLFAGIVLYWELTGYAYIEHFAIAQDRRGNSLGSKSLAVFCKQRPLVVLEIDPPVDEVSTRREGFYQRLGFLSSACAHTHPAYRAGRPPHELVIMSYPRALAMVEVGLFRRELENIVMADFGQ